MSVQVGLDGQPVGAQPVAPLPAVDLAFAGFFGAKAVACPASSCKVPAGAWCMRPSGHSGPFVAFHRERRELAGRVRLVGLACQGCGTPDGPGAYVCPVRQSPEADELGLAGKLLCRPCVLQVAPHAESTFD